MMDSEKKNNTPIQKKKKVLSIPIAIRQYPIALKGFPGGSVVKNPPPRVYPNLCPLSQ